MFALHIWSQRIKSLTGRKRLADGKWIGCVQSIIAEVAEEAAVNVIAAGLGDDVDRRAAGAARSAP
jgi:hypothetical protein